MKLTYPIDSQVIASPADAPVQGFSAIVIDYVEGATHPYIVRDQDDDVWQCTEVELSAYVE